MRANATRWTLTLAVAGLALMGMASGCGSQQQAVPPPTALAAQQAGSACPLELPGVKLSADETSDGIAMIFTTDQPAVYELRQRVLQMAHSYNQRHPGTSTAPSTARVVYIDNGARLILSPVNPADLPALRAQAQSSARYMAATNSCPVI